MESCVRKRVRPGIWRVVAVGTRVQSEVVSLPPEIDMQHILMSFLLFG